MSIEKLKDRAFQELVQTQQENAKLKERVAKLEKVLYEAEKYVMGRTIYKTDLGKAISEASDDKQD